MDAASNVLHRGNQFLSGRSNRLDRRGGAVGGTDGIAHLVIRRDNRLANFAEVFVDLLLQLGFPQPVLNLPRNIGGELHNLHRPAAGIEYWIIGGLYPNLPPPFANTLIFRSLILASTQFIPEGFVGRALSLLRFDKHRVMPTRYFGQGI